MARKLKTPTAHHFRAVLRLIDEQDKLELTFGDNPVV